MRLQSPPAKSKFLAVLTSRQALALLLFLDSEGAENEAYFLRKNIKDLFLTDEIDNLVDPLLEAISETFHKTEDQYESDMMEWSFLMGQHGSDDAAEKFMVVVSDPWPLGDFLHARYVSKANTDPLGSYTSLVEFLEGGGKGAKQGLALQNLIRAFPEDRDFDYEALELILPAGVKGPDAEVYERAHRELLTKWAEKDPSAAVNFIIDHPQRIPAKMVTFVVRQTIKDLNNEGIEWVKEFRPSGFAERTIPHRSGAAERERRAFESSAVVSASLP
jgi:hypothetical protein